MQRRESRDLSAHQEQAGQMRGFRTLSAAWLGRERHMGLLTRKLPWGFPRREIEPSAEEPVTRGELAAYAVQPGIDGVWTTNSLRLRLFAELHGVDILVLTWTRPIASTR